MNRLSANLVNEKQRLLRTLKPAEQGSHVGIANHRAVADELTAVHELVEVSETVQIHLNRVL